MRRIPTGWWPLTEPGPHCVLVIGPSGSGKSWTARWLGEALGVEAIELDALYWGPGWTAPDKAVIREELRDRLASLNGWVVDGNYGFCRDLLVPSLTAVVWLDYPIWRTQWQLLDRTFRRVLGRELLWGKNRETLGTHLREGFVLFRYSLRTQRGLRRDGIPGIPESLPVYRVRSRNELLMVRTALLANTLLSDGV